MAIDGGLDHLHTRLFYPPEKDLKILLAQILIEYK